MSLANQKFLAEPPIEPLEQRIQRIIQIRLQNTYNQEIEIGVNTPILGKGLGFDSLESLALVAEIENEFDITVDDDELTIDLFESVATLAALVRNKLVAKG